MLSLYLFVGRRRTLLLDVGVDATPQTGLLPYLTSASLDPQSIRWAVVSHADVDHFGGLASLRELSPEAECLGHRLDAPLISDYATYESVRARGFREPWGLDESSEVLAWTRSVTREGPLDLALTGGETIDLGGVEVEILHVPGHSQGHLAVYDRRSRALAVSDAVLGEMVPHADGRPAFPPTYRYVDSYLATIGLCEALRPELLLTAHYPTMRADAATEFLARSRGFVEKVEGVILDELAEAGSSGLTLQELLAKANPRLGTWPAEGTAVALAFPVVGHLERLMALGRITGWLAHEGYRVRNQP